MIMEAEERWEVAQQHLRIASVARLVVADGRSEDGDGIYYYDDIAHALDDGGLPDWVQTEPGGRDAKQARFACYAYFSGVLRGTLCAALPYSTVSKCLICIILFHVLEHRQI